MADLKVRLAKFKPQLKNPLGKDVRTKHREVEYVALIENRGAEAATEAYAEKVAKRLRDCGLSAALKRYRPDDMGSQLVGVDAYLILIGAPNKAVLHEVAAKLRIQRWLKSGGLGEPPDEAAVSKERLVPRLRLEYIYELISNSAHVVVGPPPKELEHRGSGASVSPAHSSADSKAGDAKATEDAVEDRIGKWAVHAADLLTVDKLAPLHDMAVSVSLLRDLANLKSGVFMRTELLDRLRDHFGDETAYFFAFVSHYTRMLLIPGALGIVFQIVYAVDSDLYTEFFAPYFTVGVLVWAMITLATWERLNNKLILRWDQLNVDASDQVRPNFYGQWYDPHAAIVDRKGHTKHDTPAAKLDRLELWYPNWRRWLKIGVVAPICIACFLLLLFFAGACFALEVWILDIEKVDAGAMTFLIVASPDIIFAILAAILEDVVFPPLATKLADWENHRLHSEHQASVAIMTFTMWFVSVFGYFFILAFVYVPFGDVIVSEFPGWGTETQNVSSTEKVSRVRSTLIGFFCITQAVNLVVKVLLPKLLECLGKGAVSAAARIRAEAEGAIDGVERYVEHIRDLDADEDVISVDSDDDEMAAGTIVDIQGGKGDSVQLSTNHVDGSSEAWSNAKASEAKLMTSGPEPGDSLRRIASHYVPGKAVDEQIYLEEIFEEVSRSPYEHFGDYAELACQWTYILMCAGPIFPLGAMAALINNVLEIRTDFARLAFNYSRPIPRPAGGIGVWKSILEFIGYISVFVSVALLLVTLNLGPVLVGPYVTSYTVATGVVYAFVVERALLAVNWLITRLLPAVPAEVVNELNYNQYRFKAAWREASAKSQQQRDDDAAAAADADAIGTIVEDEPAGAAAAGGDDAKSDG